MGNPVMRTAKRSTAVDLRCARGLVTCLHTRATWWMVIKKWRPGTEASRLCSLRVFRVGVPQCKRGNCVAAQIWSAFKGSQLWQWRLERPRMHGEGPAFWTVWGDWTFWVSSDKVWSSPCRNDWPEGFRLAVVVLWARPIVCQSEPLRFHHTMDCKGARFVIVVLVLFLSISLGLSDGNCTEVSVALLHFSFLFFLFFFFFFFEDSFLLQRCDDERLTRQLLFAS